MATRQSIGVTADSIASAATSPYVTGSAIVNGPASVPSPLSMASIEGFNQGGIGGRGQPLARGITDNLGLPDIRDASNLSRASFTTTAGSSESTLQLATATFVATPASDFDASMISHHTPLFLCRSVSNDPFNVAVADIPTVNNNLRLAEEQFQLAVRAYAAQAQLTTPHPRSLSAQRQLGAAQAGVLGKRTRNTLTGGNPLTRHKLNAWACVSSEHFGEKMAYCGFGVSTTHESAYGSVRNDISRPITTAYAGTIHNVVNLYGNVRGGEQVGVMLMRKGTGHEFDPVSLQNRAPLQLVPYCLTDGSRVHFMGHDTGRLVKDIERNTRQSQALRNRVAATSRTINAAGDNIALDTDSLRSYNDGMRNNYAGLTVQAYAARTADELAVLRGGGGEYCDPYNPMLRLTDSNPFSTTNAVYYDVEIIEPPAHVPGAPREEAGWGHKSVVLRRTLEAARIIPFGTVAITDQAGESDYHAIEAGLNSQMSYHMIQSRIAVHLTAC